MVKVIKGYYLFHLRFIIHLMTLARILSKTIHMNLVDVILKCFWIVHDTHKLLITKCTSSQAAIYVPMVWHYIYRGLWDDSFSIRAMARHSP